MQHRGVEIIRIVWAESSTVRASGAPLALNIQVNSVVVQLPFTQEQLFAVFSAYNTALWPFAVVLGRGVVRRDLRFSWHRSSRHIAAAVVLVYALLYPLVVMANGHSYPSMPTFGVPCPTTILTIGFLLVMEPRVRWSMAATCLPLGVVELQPNRCAAHD